MSDKGRVVPPHVSGGGQVFRRTDPDETAGRALYRGLAEAEARLSLNMSRRIRLVQCRWCNDATWYSNFGPRGVEHEVPCAYCNPEGRPKPRRAAMRSRVTPNPYPTGSNSSIRED